VVIQEALSAGLPVIATRQTGAAYDLVEEGKNGFLVEADDEDQLYDRIVWFSEHQEQIRGFGARARDRASALTPEWGATKIFKFDCGDVVLCAQERHSIHNASAWNVGALAFTSELATQAGLSESDRGKKPRTGRSGSFYG